LRDWGQRWMPLSRRMRHGRLLCPANTIWC
jgi:hypothetical protein